MFEMLESSKEKDWKFGFNEWYDITVWDLVPVSLV